MTISALSSRSRAAAAGSLGALAAIAVIAVLIVAGLPSQARAQDDAATAQGKAFVVKLGDEAISFLADKSLSPEQRASRFAELFRDKFAVESIARFVAGAAWRAGTEAQQTEYVDLFTNFVVNTYAQRLSQYSGEKLKVGTARKIDDSVVVGSEIVQVTGPATKVDWRLRESGGSFKILDVIIEGISMAITQRSEFASVMRSGGGGLDSLIAALKRNRFSQ
ncbi:MAG: ABC transporter substrate-binding protein [Sneathiellaceae bacterium]